MDPFRLRLLSSLVFVVLLLGAGGCASDNHRAVRGNSDMQAVWGSREANPRKPIDGPEQSYTR